MALDKPEGGWFKGVQNAQWTSVDAKQKIISRWLNEGGEWTQKPNLGYPSWFEGDCKLFFYDAAMGEKKSSFTKKVGGVNIWDLTVVSFWVSMYNCSCV